MKTKEELKTLKEKVETLNKKLAELTEEELVQVTGGDSRSNVPGNLPKPHDFNDEEPILSLDSVPHALSKSGI